MKNHVVRLMTNDYAFRLIVLSTTQLARDGAQAQGVSGANARLLGELMTGVVLVRETMAPGYRVQLILKDGKDGSVVADSYPDGLVRGLVQADDDVTVGFGPESTLQVMRVLPKGELNQGVVPAAGQARLSGALTSYMITSEQITSVIDVACVLGEDGSPELAGGYIIQLLPEHTEEALALLTARLETMPPAEELFAAADGDPLAVTEVLLKHFPYTVLDESEVHHGCTCSEVRMVGAMATLGRDEIASIVERGEVLEVSCDYCGTDYSVGPERLRPLLARQ
jgi:molecular chaperone Hsp33